MDQNRSEQSSNTTFYTELAYARSTGRRGLAFKQLIKCTKRFHRKISQLVHRAAVEWYNAAPTHHSSSAFILWLYCRQGQQRPVTMRFCRGWTLIFKATKRSSQWSEKASMNRINKYQHCQPVKFSCRALKPTSNAEAKPKNHKLTGNRWHRLTKSRNLSHSSRAPDIQCVHYIPYMTRVWCSMYHPRGNAPWYASLSHDM